MRRAILSTLNKLEYCKLHSHIALILFLYYILYNLFINNIPTYYQLAQKKKKKISKKEEGL